MQMAREKARSAKIGGVALIVYAVFYLAGYVLASPLVGLEDGDNPLVSLAFLRQDANLYFLSGLAAVLAAILLVVSVLALHDMILQSPASIIGRTATAFGLFTAAFIFGHGILRMNAPGTLLYMESLDPAWGQAAYLAVQTVGTQGLAAAGIFGFSIWAVGLSVAGRRQGALPLGLAMLGIVPTLPWLMGLLGRAGILPDSLWLLYIVSIILGIPIWSVVLGVFFLKRKS